MTGRFTDPGGVDDSSHNLPRHHGVVLKVVVESLVDKRFDDSLHLAVAELGLRLSLELGFPKLDAYDRGHPLPDVVAGDFELDPFVEAELLHVGVDGPGDTGFESGEVGSPSTVLMLLTKE